MAKGNRNGVKREYAGTVLNVGSALAAIANHVVIEITERASLMSVVETSSSVRLGDAKLCDEKPITDSNKSS